MQFEEPKKHWVALKWGPLLFRRNHDGEEFKEGKTEKQLSFFLVREVMLELAEVDRQATASLNSKDIC